jgi:hypothetical protein
MLGLLLCYRWGSTGREDLTAAGCQLLPSEGCKLGDGPHAEFLQQLVLLRLCVLPVSSIWFHACLPVLSQRNIQAQLLEYMLQPSNALTAGFGQLPACVFVSVSCCRCGRHSSVRVQRRQDV